MDKYITPPRGQKMEQTVENCQRQMAADAVTIEQQARKIRQLQQRVDTLERKYIQAKADLFKERGRK